VVGYEIMKATDFGEKRQEMAVTPFKVIQGHRFWYQLKVYMRLLIGESYKFTSYLFEISRIIDRMNEDRTEEMQDTR